MQAYKKQKLSKQEYKNLHVRISRNWGKADHCENPDCKRESLIFEWALIHGKKYEFRRSNFIQLCVKCHRDIDLKGLKHSKVTREKISIGNIGKKLSEEAIQKIREKATGRLHKEEIKTKISQTMIERGINRKKQAVLSCPHCGKEGGGSLMKRFHFDNCKLKIGRTFSVNVSYN